MSLSMTIRRQLEEQAPFHDDGIRDFWATDQGVSVRCQIAGSDRYGCALKRLEVVEEVSRVLQDDELAKRAEILCGKIVYLTEPLRQIELDPLSHSVLVRSSSPRVADEEITYYELLATGDRHTTLGRIRFDRSSRSRHHVEFLLSRDQLGMLIDDLVTTVVN
ncbi:hypothetical protein Pan216_08120 [Planctomycetes bacterium Pan216]|uniref:Uncharacterized protein n=1 Tax=Kolteria novifilia TaxID=2527975 RepID=A0A518AZ19_9BACT|nr:hypothetical protein Pan216_08120 [Planctomycetes bacterium Pan216]